MVDLPPFPLRLSQGHLNLLRTCPRKFQYSILERIPYPLPPEQQEHLEWGSQFHLLMQQRELGLPLPPFLALDPRFQSCWEGLIEANPSLFAPSPSVRFRASEHQRTIGFQGYLITVIYDLVILAESVGKIIDWKTYNRPETDEVLKENWQTRLYLFVLKETSDYYPEQLAMIYWFVKPQSQDKKILKNIPQATEIRYNQKEHESTEKQLHQQLNQLTQWLQEYERGIDFPQVPVSASQCSHCPFALRCDRHPLTSLFAEEEFTPYPLEKIPAIPL